MMIPAAFSEEVGSGSVLIEKKPEGVTKVSVSWTSNVSGAVRIHIDTPIVGRPHMLRTKPSQTSAPTDLYDITWEDSLGRDILDGQGMNRSTSTVQEIPVYVQDTTNAAAIIDVDGPTVFKVANAGGAKSGTAVLWLKDKDFLLTRI